MSHWRACFVHSISQLLSQTRSLLQLIRWRLTHIVFSFQVYPVEALRCQRSFNDAHEALLFLMILRAFIPSGACSLLRLSEPSLTDSKLLLRLLESSLTNSERFLISGYVTDPNHEGTLQGCPCSSCLTSLFLATRGTPLLRHVTGYTNEGLLRLGFKR